MKINILFILVVNFMIAQPDDNLYTLVTKLNYSSSITTAQNKAGSLNTSDGFVSDIGTTFSNKSYNISGGAFDPNNFRMLLMTENSTITSFDFNDGSIVSIPLTSSYIGSVYFDNISFSSSNNTLYGLVRPFGSNNNSQGIFLGKLNVSTGEITTLSQNSIANQYELAGTIIDPELMVYYFKTGSKFLGIDLYNGNIYSQPDVTYDSNDYSFTNFTYNCADNTIYGIAREMTNIQQPNAPIGVYIQHFRLAKIDPATGIVTRISETILPSNYYSANAGSTINPSTNTYFYSDNSFLYGVSLTTGEIVINIPLVFENGDIINFISSTNECLGATPSRLDPNLSVENANLKNNFEVYPNPVSSILTIKSEMNIDKLEIFDSLGRLIDVEVSIDSIDVSNFQSGTYIARISSGNVVQNIRFIKN